MRLSAVVLLSLSLTVAHSAPQASKRLEIYVVDVEGGNATLVRVAVRRVAAHRHRECRRGRPA